MTAAVHYHFDSLDVGRPGDDCDDCRPASEAYAGWMPAELGGDERAALRRRQAAAAQAAAPAGEALCPKCGTDLGVGPGNPDCDVCAGEPDPREADRPAGHTLAGFFATGGDLAGIGYCSLHERFDCSLCDECGHESASHVEVETTGGEPTCWGQDRCSECVADRTARLTAMQTGTFRGGE